MVARRVHALSVLTLCLACGAQLARAQGEATLTASQPAVEYSLLQPALAGKYSVKTVDDMTLFVSGPTNSVRSATLRELVAKEGYDASAHLAAALRSELETAGFTTELVGVPRAPAGEPQRLTRGDLPSNARGKFLVDVVIDAIELAAEANAAPWEPAFALSWRVMRPNGQIVVPTRTFIHGPYYNYKAGRFPSRSKCDLPSFNVTVKSPQLLWACFELGFSDASRVLVPLIRQAQDSALDGK
jgi:hypothetical protein